MCRTVGCVELGLAIVWKYSEAIRRNQPSQREASCSNNVACWVSELSAKVQELVPNAVCEHRVLCFHDAAAGNWAFCRERLWMTMKSPGSHHKHQAVLIGGLMRLSGSEQHRPGCP